MEKIYSVRHEEIFKYFYEICSIPHGSGDMGKISSYCMEFAKKHGLDAVCDDAKNVIIYKNGSKGYEGSEPIILQGHLDMVCQKTEESGIDFFVDGITVLNDGDYLVADGTTLGADNGIAVSMILAILASKDLPHPPIEAVFTTDEEIGMLGAMALDFSRISAKKMINIDSEEQDVLTVSCAGGSDFKFLIKKETEEKTGTEVVFAVRGLKGGHSGVEINSGRVNANVLMARILNHVKNDCDFDILSVNGGDKSNAIPVSSKAVLITKNAEQLKNALDSYCEIIKKEISEREKGFAYDISINDEKNFVVLNRKTRDKLIFLMLCTPNGVVEMSAEIENLVETSLNLGILKTEEDEIILHYALRSNKKSAMAFLEEKLKSISSFLECEAHVFGHYPPWEYKENSKLQRIYKEKYKEKFGDFPKVEAIHAGLECGVFASKTDDMDCISIGPDMKDVHTVNERLSISSTEAIFDILLEVLKALK